MPTHTNNSDQHPASLLKQALPVGSTDTLTSPVHKVPAPDHRREPATRQMHGVQWVDHYFWMIDPDKDSRQKMIDAENTYSHAILGESKAFQDRIANELKSRVDDTDQSVPLRYDTYVYWSRYEVGLEYPQHCRKLASESDRWNQPVEVFLDENSILVEEYAELGDWTVSCDHRYVIYTVDDTGDEEYDLFIKHLATGQTWQKPNGQVGVEICWSRTSSGFFYTQMDDQGRVFEVMFHQLGTAYSADRSIYIEDDPQFEIGIERSRDEQWLVITTAGADSSEVWLLPLTDYPGGSKQFPQPKCIQSRQSGLEYYVEPQGDRLVILCNDDPSLPGEFAVKTTHLASTARENWDVLLAPTQGRHYEWVVAYKQFLLLHEINNGRQRYRQIDQLQNQRSSFVIEAQRPTEQLEFVDDGQCDINTVRFERSSLTQPERTEQYDLLSHALEVLREDAPDDDYTPDDYVEECIDVVNGSVSIPVSIVYRKSCRLADGNPLCLYGYGAYETGVETDFDADRLTLLDRGVVYAIAHVRGGDEKGRSWYDAGRLANKENSFTDFISVARALIDRGYTQAGKIVVQGESAGGLLVAVAVNNAPELFAGVVAQVPFVDVVETMLNDQWPTTVQDYDEFGDPNDPHMFAVHRRYCPYTNIKSAYYPPMFVTCSVNDQRVPWWEATRWVAKLRHKKLDDNPVLLKIIENSGHQGSSGRTQELRQTAQVYAFILQCLGLDDLCIVGQAGDQVL